MKQRNGPGRVLANFWRGRDVGIVYSCAVVVASVWIAARPDAETRVLVESVSTNLENMRSHPIAVLAASAFVVSPLSQLLLIPVVIFVYGLVQRWLGRTALIAAVVFGHVGATLFVMSMEITALYLRIARFSIVVKPDVGVSYGMAAGIGLLAARVPHRWQLPYAAGCLAVVAAMLAIWPDFTSLGHLTAIVIGLALAAVVHGAEVAGSSASAAVRRRRPPDPAALSQTGRSLAP